MIIVRDKNTCRKYILLGTGYGAYKAVSPSFFGGKFLPHEEEGILQTVAVCNKSGDIIWYKSSELQVVEIDGIKVSDIDLEDDDNRYEYCPACGVALSIGEKICHSCGITILD